MTVTIIGRLADTVGAYRHLTLQQGRWAPELVKSFGAAPGGEYRSRQRGDMPLELDHGRRIGRCRHLERNAGNVWLVATIDAPLSTIPTKAIYLSPSITSNHNGTDVELRSVSLVDDPASIGAQPVHELAGDLRDACRESWRLRNSWLSEVLERARDSTTGTATIYEKHRTGVDHWSSCDHDRRWATGGTAGRSIRLRDGSTAELEYFSGGYILGVR